MDENSNSQSSSESVEVQVGMNHGGSPLMNGTMEQDHYSDEENGRPYIEIIEQPQQRGFRFRYECEGPSHGGLQGNNSEKFKKTVPTIKIRNYSGYARVIVSLVTHESVPKPHAHKLVGKHCQNGLCQVDIKPGMPQISFSNLCVQHVTRRRAAEVLEQRILNSYQVQKQVNTGKFNIAFKPTDDEIKQAKAEAQTQSKNMALNVVRLCFQVFLMDSAGNQNGMLNSVVSEPIYDSKAPGANALKICRMDKYSGCCTGNEEVFLLCEKVQREDIMVKFVEKDDHGNTLWEAQGQFGPFDVHRQFAIVFKTPEYKDTNIGHPVNVLVMLVRKSDNEASDPKAFTYYPKAIDKEEIIRKRKKTLPGDSFDPSKRRYPDIDPNNHFGGPGKGSSGGHCENGLPNGASIPNFDNMSKNPFGSSQQVPTRYILKAQTQNTRTKVPPIPPMDPNLVNFLTNPNGNYQYEDVSIQDPQLFNSMNSPPQMDTSPTLTKFPLNNTPINNPYDNSNMTGSPNNGSSMIGSPQSVNGAMHMQAISPNSMNPISPQGGGIGSPQAMADASQPGIPSSQIGNGYIQQPVLCTGDIKVEQGTIVEQVSSAPQFSQPMMDQAPIRHPIQDTSLEIDFIENNFNFLQENHGQNFMFPHQSVHEIRNSLNAYDIFPSTCNFQARGSSNETVNLQDLGFDFVDSRRADNLSQGYDEVDAARMQGPMPGLEMPADLELKKSKKFLTKCYNSKLDKAMEAKYVEAKNVVVKEEPVSDDAIDVLETNFAVKTLRTADVAVQTDMDYSTHHSLIRTADALQYYAASGDIRSLLVVQRYLMLVQNQDGDLPLHTSLINQKYEVFQNLLDVMKALPDSYSQINAYNFHHQTPLHLAVITNQHGAVDLLIRAGGDWALTDRNGYTPVHLAVIYKHTECLKNLLRYVKPNTDLNNPFPELNIRCYSGFTAAHLAAQFENLEAMKWLVFCKADMNAQDGKSGQTPLHHAVERDDLSLAAYLILQAGSSVNTKRFDGNTPLHIACGRGNVGMVALLMAGGADPNIENDDVEDSSIEPAEMEDENDKPEVIDSLTTEPDQTARGDDEIEKSVSIDTNKLDKSVGPDKETAKKRDSDKEDGRDSENSGTDEDDLKTSVIKQGLLPADFANGNEKILRVLNGEPYRTLKTDADKDDTFSCNDEEKIDRLTSIHYSKIESGIGSMSLNSTGGDIETLDIQTRVHLSELLDPNLLNSDWITLGDKLGLKHFMEGRRQEQSPTGLLLTSFELIGGTVSMLCDALSHIKREDAVSAINLLQKQMPDKTDFVSPKEGRINLVKDPQIDSGTGLESPISGH